MKTKEFDDILNEALLEETKKLIKEQISDLDHLVDSIKSFQTLSGLVDKITNIEGDLNNLKIEIDGVTPSDLASCCGGDSLGQTQMLLMQGLHHDLDELGLNQNYDIHINTEGNKDSLHLTISISPNDDELSNENDTDMTEQTDNGELKNTFGQPMYEEQPKDTNPEKDEKKDIILGDEEVDEQEQTAAGAMAAEEELDESGEKWIQKAFNKIEKKGTEGKCTGKKFGSDSCPEGSKAYNMAKTLRKINEDSGSKKNVLRLTESEMKSLIEKIILEAKIETPNISVPANGVPGVDVTKRVTREAGKENAEALKAVEEKIKKALSFEGNDDPKSPDQIGKGKEKVSINASDSQEEEIELNRGRNPADLTYDSDPGERFKERARLSLVGAAEMGNSPDYANVVNPESKVGENIFKASEKRKEARENEPIYDKEAVPVKDEDNKPNRPRVDDAVSSDILKMKQLSKYNKKTQ